MSNTAKILVLLVIIVLLIAGAVYFRSSPGSQPEPAVTDDPALRQSLLEGGDEDVTALLSSLDEEQTGETGVLAGEDVDGALSVEENLLADDVNKLNQNEI